MSRSSIGSTRLLSRPTLLLAAAGAGGALLLSGCSAGQVTQTAVKTPSVPGVNVDAKGIAIRNALVAFPATGEFAPGGSADLSLRIVSTGNTPDRLVSATSDVTGYVQLVGEPTPDGSASPSSTPSGTPSATPSGTPSATPPATGAPSATPQPGTVPSGSPNQTRINLVIPAAGLVSLEEGGQRLVLQNLTKAIRPGDIVKVTLMFELAGELTLELPVAAPATPQPRASAETGEHES